MQTSWECWESQAVTLVRHKSHRQSQWQEFINSQPQVGFPRLEMFPDEEL